MHQTLLRIEIAKVELRWLKGYVLFLDGSIDRELREIKLAASNSDDERYIDKLIDDHYMVGFHFSKHTMYTSFTLVHSFLERSLSDIVEQISKDRPDVIRPSDLAGEDSADRSKNYLKKVVRLDLSSGAWSELRPYIEVRNLLVHSLGEIRSDCKPKRKQIVEQFSRSNSNLSIDSNSLVFGKELVIAYIAIINTLLNDLKSSVSSWDSVRLENA